MSLAPDDFAECVLYCRIVAVDEVAIDKLDGERRFACTKARHPRSPQSPIRGVGTKGARRSERMAWSREVQGLIAVVVEGKDEQQATI